MDNLINQVQNVDKSISALQDSVDLINAEIEKAVDTNEARDAIRRNYQHLEIMLDKDYIIDSGEDLSESIAAISAAKTYLGE